MLGAVDLTTPTTEGSPLMNPKPNPASNVDPSSATSCSEVDLPYIFGRRPSVIAPFPFTPREFGGLLVLRGRVQDGLVGVG